MKLIVGLGNPGIRYAKTRHNLGRLCVAFMAETEGARWVFRKTLKSSVCCLDWEDQEVILASPEASMNVSGDPLARLVAHYEIAAPEDLLVIVDDLALPLGRLRLRGKGSDGGHNGLRSIQEALGSSVFARLRCGIGHPRDPESSGPQEVSEYVLSPFLREEIIRLGEVYEKAALACRLWACESLQKASDAITR